MTTPNIRAVLQKLLNEVHELRLEAGNPSLRSAIIEARAALAAEPELPADVAIADSRSCTCHPDDNPPTPCPKRYALDECRESADREVAELVAWLRNEATQHGDSWPEASSKATRLADFVERLAPQLVQVCERDLDSILSPSGGYELREEAVLAEDAQLIGGEWWAPVFGCDSVEHTLERIRQRLDPFQENGSLTSYQTFAPSPVPVSERLPEPTDCDAKGQCWWFHPEDDSQWDVWCYSRGNGLGTHWLPANALPIPAEEV